MTQTLQTIMRASALPAAVLVYSIRIAKPAVLKLSPVVPCRALFRGPVVKVVIAHTLVSSIRTISTIVAVRNITGNA